MDSVPLGEKYSTSYKFLYQFLVGIPAKTSSMYVWYTLTSIKNDVIVSPVGLSLWLRSAYIMCARMHPSKKSRPTSTTKHYES